MSAQASRIGTSDSVSSDETVVDDRIAKRKTAVSIREPPLRRATDYAAGPTLTHRLSEIGLTVDPNPAQNTLKVRPWRTRVTPFQEILDHKYPGKGTQEAPYIVQFLPHDVENPLHFPALKMWSYLWLVAFATLAVALASSLYTGGAESIIRHFECSEELFVLGLSFFVVGFAVGPLLWAPLSELFGRRIIFIVSYSMFTLFNGVAAASPNIGSLIVFRFLAGAFGSSPLTNSGGTIADMFPAHKRAIAMSLFASAPFLGPTIGPIGGGFLGASSPEGWRYNQILLCAFSALLTILLFLFLGETYAPRLLRLRAARLSKFTGKVYRAPMDLKEELDIGRLMKTALSRPWILLFKEPVVSLISLYMAVVYGTLYMFFSAFPIVFQEGRGWSPGIGGLPFLAIFVGMIFSLAYIIFYDNPRYIRVSERLGGAAPPEQRLPPAMLGSILLVIGLAWFTGTCGPTTPWILPVIASAFFGSGLLLVFVALSNYLVDSYLIFAASCLAGNSVLRSTFGAVFLFTTQMYHKLGVHGASAVPTGIAAVMIPLPFLFYRYGAAIRKRCKYSAEAAKLWEDMISRRKSEKEAEPAKPPTSAQAKTLGKQAV